MQTIPKIGSVIYAVPTEENTERYIEKYIVCRITQKLIVLADSLGFEGIKLLHNLTPYHKCNRRWLSVIYQPATSELDEQFAHEGYQRFVLTRINKFSVREMSKEKLKLLLDITSTD